MRYEKHENMRNTLEGRTEKMPPPSEEVAVRKKIPPRKSP